MRIFRVILSAALLLALPMPAVSAAPNWEAVSIEVPAAVAEANHPEVEVKDGYIYVYTPKAVNIKVLSIVGRLISEIELNPGVSRLKVTARGIYILKVGGYTMRVTV